MRSAGAISRQTKSSRQDIAEFKQTEFTCHRAQYVCSAARINRAGKSVGRFGQCLRTLRQRVSERHQCTYTASTSTAVDAPNHALSSPMHQSPPLGSTVNLTVGIWHKKEANVFVLMEVLPGQFVKIGPLGSHGHRLGRVLTVLIQLCDGSDRQFSVCNHLAWQLLHGPLWYTLTGHVQV